MVLIWQRMADCSILERMWMLGFGFCLVFFNYISCCFHIEFGCKLKSMLCILHWSLRWSCPDGTSTHFLSDSDEVDFWVFFMQPLTESINQFGRTLWLVSPIQFTSRPLLLMACKSWIVSINSSISFKAPLHYYSATKMTNHCRQTTIKSE